MESRTPDRLNSVSELEAYLSIPSQAVIDLMKRLDGDVMVIGATGKVGPTVARVALRAIKASGVPRRLYAVARSPMEQLEAEGACVIRCDLQNPEEVAALPKVRNVVFMVGFKFGAASDTAKTWAINAIVPYHVARHFQGARIVVYSTGCVYPVMDLSSGGATEDTPAAPIGEYTQSCLARERMFDVFASRNLEQVVHFRLNYSVECRYGVLYDVGIKVWNGEAVDVTTGYANCLWQGDVANLTWRCLELASSPSVPVNITGPETFSIRWAAEEFGRLMGRKPMFTGTENGRGYLSNASKAISLFGYPSVTLLEALRLVAHWIMDGGAGLDKPTHFETQDGRY